MDKAVYAVCDKDGLFRYMRTINTDLVIDDGKLVDEFKRVGICTYKDPKSKQQSSFYYSQKKIIVVNVVSKDFLKDLANSHNLALKLGTFKTYFPDGVMGEDFYPGISTEVAFANSALQELINHGFMKHLDPELPEYEIMYIV